MNVRRWLENVPIQDPIHQPLAPVLQSVLLVMMVAVLAALIMNVFVFGVSSLTLEGLLPYTLFMIAPLITFALIRRGFFTWSLAIIIIAMLLGQAQTLVDVGLSQNKDILLISIVPITIAGLLLNPVALWLTTAANIVIILLINAAQQQPAVSLVAYLLIMLVFSFLIASFSSTLRKALLESIIRERDLMTAWRTLADTNRELAEQREWFQVTLSSIGDGVITTDTRHQVTFINPVAETLTGWTQPINQPLERVFNIADEVTLKPVENPLKRVLAEGVIVGLSNHTVLISKEGKQIPIADSGAPIRDMSGSIIGAVLIFRDVTEQREAQLALEESEKRFRAMADSAPVMIWVSGPDKLGVYFNKPWLEFTGRTLEQELGNGWLETIHPDDYERCITICTTAAEQHKEFHMDYRMRRADGEYRWVQDHGIPRFSADGEFEGYIGSMIDITEKKIAYELEQQARIRAEEANSLKMKFLAMISHELRTPLTAIKGFTSTLLSEDVQWSETDQKEFIRIMDEEADRLTGLVEQLLDVSRLQAGNLSIDPKPHNLNDIVRSAAAQLNAVTIQHDLLIDLPPDLPPVQADANRVVQVIVNLVSNAVKYSPPYTRIIVSASHKADAVQVDVIDAGVGIPESEREHVFEAFRQLDRKLSSQGAGLGLAICKGFVEAHNGRIWIQGGIDKGTCVSFTLPVAKS